MTDTDAATGSTNSTDSTAQGRSTTGPRMAAVVVATMAAAVVWFVARVAFDVDITATTGDSETTVALPSVIVATLVSGLLGWGMLELIERKASSPRTVWTVVATVAFVLSLLAGPLGGVTTGAKIALVALHAVAALVLIPGFARTTRKR